jgi:phage baseplate assembly protein gpV
VSAGLYDGIARIARHEARARALPAIGVVDDIHPAEGGPPDHAVSITLRDSGAKLPRVPIAVGALGFAAIPAVGDLVILVFLDGELNAPVVVGRLYHPDLQPPEHAAEQLVLALPPGAAEPDLRLVVDGSAPSATLTLPGDVTLEIKAEDVRVAVGGVELHLTGAGGGRAELSAGGSSITLKQDGDISIEAVGNLKLKGTQVSIEGSAKVSVKGAVVELN